MTVLSFTEGTRTFGNLEVLWEGVKEAVEEGSNVHSCSVPGITAPSTTRPTLPDVFCFYNDFFLDAPDCPLLDTLPDSSVYVQSYLLMVRSFFPTGPLVFFQI